MPTDEAARCAAHGSRRTVFAPSSRRSRPGAAHRGRAADDMVPPRHCRTQASALAASSASSAARPEAARRRAARQGPCRSAPEAARAAASRSAGGELGAEVAVPGAVAPVEDEAGARADGHLETAAGAVAAVTTSTVSPRDPSGRAPPSKVRTACGRRSRAGRRAADEGAVRGGKRAARVGYARTSRPAPAPPPPRGRRGRARARRARALFTP